MSLRDCINDAVAAGEMDRGRAREALDLLGELEEDLRRRFGETEAQRLAADKLSETLKRTSVERRRQEMLQVKATQRHLNALKSYRNLNDDEDLGAALVAHLDWDELAPFSSVTQRQAAIRGRLHARMTDVLATFRRDVVGRVREKATLHDLVREAFGEDTGNANARELSKAWKETADFARLRFNSAGGHISKRQDWGMPQHHNTLEVRKASFNQWRDFILPKLDRAKMIDEQSGLPFSNFKLEQALRDSYDAIATDGFSKVRPSIAAGSRKLANRRADHRFLVFRSADDWLAYQERFGDGDVFSVMMGHLDAMARDIALMEVLGPNPNLGLRHMAQTAEKRAAEFDSDEGTDKHLARVQKKVKQANDMMAHLTGAVNAPVDGMVARGFMGLRSLLQSAQLGSAALSAITDLNFSRMAARHAGLDQVKTISQVLKQLNPANMDDRKTAVRLGLIAENWSQVASAQARYVGEVSGPEITRRISDAVMRISGLSPWTQAGRWAFGLEFFGTLAGHIDNDFDVLPDPLRRTMEKYGFTASDWDVIRNTPLHEAGDGATFLRPDDIAARADLPPDRADELATRLLEMVQTETEFAVPSSSLRGRALLIGDNRPGTLQGEVLRSLAMYKNFAVTVAFTHIRRAVLKQGTLSKGGYAAELVISATLMGALALQLKEIAKGRDPKPMFPNELENKVQFWSAAMLQGGGIGIFGDFLFSDINRFGQGLETTAAGPVVGFLDDLRRVTVGNAVELARDEETQAGRELIQFAKRYTPGGSLWYARLGLERLVFDQLQLNLDPDARRRFRRMERRFKREYGQGFFWRPGRTSPARPPDLAKAVK